MKRSIKLLALVLSAITVMAVFTACKFNTSTSVTYDVTTGDKITLKLDTTEGYSQDMKNPFTIQKDGKTVLQGTFVDMETYTKYEDQINLGGIDALEQGVKDSNRFYFYTVDNGTNTEYDFLVKVEGSNTGILLGSTLSEEEARNCFDCIIFTLEK